MVTLLAGIFIQEKEDKAKIRQAYGVLCGIVGIILNVCLFAGKVSGWKSQPFHCNYGRCV